MLLGGKRHALKSIDNVTVRKNSPEIAYAFIQIMRRTQR